MNWPTPTPIPLPDATPVFGSALDGVSITLAEGVVQGYQQAQQHGAMDVLFLALLAFLIIGGIWSIIYHLRHI